MAACGTGSRTASSIESPRVVGVVQPEPVPARAASAVRRSAARPSTKTLGNPAGQDNALVTALGCPGSSRQLVRILSDHVGQSPRTRFALASAVSGESGDDHGGATPGRRVRPGRIRRDAAPAQGPVGPHLPATGTARRVDRRRAGPQHRGGHPAPVHTATPRGGGRVRAGVRRGRSGRDVATGPTPPRGRSVGPAVRRRRTRRRSTRSRRWPRSTPTRPAHAGSRGPRRWRCSSSPCWPRSAWASGSSDATTSRGSPPTPPIRPRRRLTVPVRRARGPVRSAPSAARISASPRAATAPASTRRR